MKRIVSLILVAAMVVGFMPMISFRAFAEDIDETQQSVVVEEATQPQEEAPAVKAEEPSPKDERSQEEKRPVKALDENSKVISEADIRIAVSTPGKPIPAAPVVIGVDPQLEATAQWGNPEYPASTDTVFQEGKDYHLTVTLYAPEGYTFVDTDEEWDYSLSVGNTVGYPDVYVSADGKRLEIYDGVYCQTYEFLNTYLEGAPNKISVGAATVPVVTAEGAENVTITGVRWVDTNRNPVSSFENEKSYFLAVDMTAPEGYVFEAGYTYFNLAYREHFSIQMHNERSCTAYFYYSTLEHIQELDITGTKPQVGMDVNSLTASVSGNATLEGIRIYDQDEYEYVTEGVFQPNKVYEIEYSLKAKSGYDFWNWIDYTVNGRAYEIHYYGTEVVLSGYFSTYPTVERVDVTLTPYTPDMKVSDVQVTVDPNADYEVSWMGVYGDNGHLSSTDILAAGKDCEVWFDLEPKEGYVFAEDCQLYINGQLAADYDVEPDQRTIAVHEVYGKSLWYIDAENVPAQIYAGAAPSTETISSISEDAQITGAQWVDENKNPVASFQDGKIYYLALNVRVLNGYILSDETSVGTDGGIRKVELKRLTDTTAVLYIRYSLRPHAGNLVLSTTKNVVAGMNISDLSGTVEGNAYISDIRVYIYSNGERITSGVFENRRNYTIEYELKPKDGYDFTGKLVIVDFNDRYSFGCSDAGTGVIVIRDNISTFPTVDRVDLTIGAVEAGMKVNEIAISVPDNANYELVWVGVLPDNSNIYLTGDSLVPDGEVELRYELETKSGYAFNKDCVCYINGEAGRSFWVSDLSNYTFEGMESYGKTVNFIRLYGVPSEIDPDEFPDMDPYEEDGQLIVTNAKWVDENKNPVTKFEDGKAYYLELTCEAVDGAAFGETATVWAHWEYWTNEYKKVDKDTAIIYLRYSLEPSVGDVKVTFNGFQVGADVSKVSATVDGKATVGELCVYEICYDTADEYYFYDEVTAGVFRKDVNYQVELTLDAEKGYRFTWDCEMMINGQLTDFQFSDGSFAEMDEMLLSFNPRIETVAVTMDTVSVGKNIADAYPKTPADALYTLDYRWVDDDWDAVEGKFEKGKKYYLLTNVHPKSGYLFDENNMVVTFNGKETDEYYFNYDGIDGVSFRIQEEFSFLDQITKVELPALPKTPTVGQTLPTTLSVGSDKPYTVELNWYDSNWETVETATEKGIYELDILIEPKAGYEFASDVQIYVDGKLNEDFYGGSDYCEGDKYYNVGLPEITKVELTVAALEAGKLPAVTAPNNANYSVYASWYQNSTGDPEDESVWAYAALEGNKYAFLVVTLRPKEGYAFAEDVTWYINGKKTEAGEEYFTVYMGNAYFNMGKVGAVTKPLSAPKISVSGETISWAAVANADSYDVYRATSKSGTYSKITTVTETSYTDSADGKIYYYKVKAVYSGNTKMNSGYSNYVSVTFKVDAPVISVENDSKGKPKLSWSKVSGASKYTVYRSTSETSGFKSIGTSKTTSYTDSKASAGTTYYYKVIANGSKSSLNSGYSNVVSCNVICGTPTVTVKIDANTGKPSLSWGKVSGAAKYAVYRDGELLATVTAVTYADTTAAIDTQYTYAVQALGKTEELNGAVSKAVTATSGIAKPDVKGSIDAVSGKPVLTWDAIEGAVKYEVYRSTKSNKSYVLIGTVEGCSYTDETVSAGKTYYYQVKAIGEVSKSALSAYDKLTGKCATPVISVANDSKGKPVISWSKVASAKKYTVYRSTNATSGFKSIGTSKTTSYTDTKATPGIVYYYKVIANASSSKYNSGYSNIVSCGCYCGIPAVKVSNNSAGKVTLSWSKISGAVKYEIYLLGAEDYVTLGVVTGTSWTDTGAGIGEGRYYGVRAIAANEDYNSEVSEPVFGRTTCATPKITGKVGINKKPVITWGEIEGATQYIVYRSTSKSKGFTVIAETGGLNWEDLTAKKGKTYYYKVVAVGDSCQSAMSSYAKVKSK